MGGVYISFPFCSQKCTYCNFASGVFPAELESSYTEALVSELSTTEWPWMPETIYLGGGTPSSIPLDRLEAVLAAIPGRPWREATLEAAPGGITREKADAWLRLGLNRVSLGVQSFVDAELRWTGRKHDAVVVERDVATLRAAGITEISIDLIAGLPSQTSESWRASLDWIEKLRVPHVSVYMLEVDEDSRLGLELLNGGLRYGAGDVPTEERIAGFYEEAVDRLSAMGLVRYEISNFAHPGHESVHNLKYWKLQQYWGFGADAHSFDGALRWQNVESAREYVDLVKLGQSPRETAEPAHLEDERFYIGLRLMSGIHLSPAERARHADTFVRLTGAGLLEDDGQTLRLTRRGVLLSNEVFGEFLTHA